MSHEIDRMQLNYDSVGYVMPPEVYTSQGSKNYFARISGRHLKYKWNRQWVQKFFPTPVGGPKYSRAGFQLGEVYEFHASYQPKSESEIEEKKRAAGKKYEWQVERISRIKSKYNGFWECVGIDDKGIKMKKLYPGDMSMRFPSGGASSDDKQTKLSDYFGTDGREHIL